MKLDLKRIVEVIRSAVSVADRQIEEDDNYLDQFVNLLEEEDFVKLSDVVKTIEDNEYIAWCECYD